MIRIHRTFEVVTPESAEDGEAADSGFLSENESVTFRELVHLMNDYCVPSNSRPSGSVNDWLSTHPSQDYRDCSETTESLHYSRENPPRRLKYWRKAMRAAGIIRR
jgi:hypothetical protein